MAIELCPSMVLPLDGGDVGGDVDDGVDDGVDVDNQQYRFEGQLRLQIRIAHPQDWLSEEESF